MNWLAPLLAADTDWVRVIVFIVAIAIYAINHLVGGLKKAAPGKPPRMPPAPRPMAPPEQRPIPAEPVAPRRQELNAELSDFLRRAAEKRGEAAARSMPAAPLAPPPSAASPQRKRKKSATPSTVEVSTVDEPLSKRRSLPSLETSAIEDRGSQLSQLGQLAKTDEIQEHIQETFNRQLGNLSSAMESAATTEPVVPGEQPTAAFATPADSLFALLRDPQSLRGAIILNEIIVRPEHRW